MGAELDGAPVARFRAGRRCRRAACCGSARSRAPGSRALHRRARRARRPDYLGSRATFTLGLLRRPRRPSAPRGRRAAPRRGDASPRAAAAPLARACVPPLTSDWEIARALRPARRARLLHRPTTSRRSSPPRGRSTTTPSRTGVRLIGPKPDWARTDGGEAGLHPSNIHDNAYAIGTIDFTGDMPVILGPRRPEPRRLRLPGHDRRGRALEDGPAQGRATPSASCRDAAPRRARIAQRRGTSDRHARRRRAARRACALALEVARRPRPTTPCSASCRATRPPSVTIRQDGDAYLLVEYGPMVLDLAPALPRPRADGLARARRRSPASSISPRHPLAPHPLRRRASCRASALLDAARRAEDELSADRRASRCPRASCTCRSPGTIPRRCSRSASTCSRCAPTRPGARATSSSSAASTDSTASTRSARSSSTPAIWCWGWATSTWARRSPRRSTRATGWSPPSTTRRAPGRRRTPSGIGGAYLCVYGMEGPGGYQFVGRTCQMWNRLRPRDPGEALAAALLRPDPLLPGHRAGAARLPRGVPARARQASHRSRPPSDCGDYQAFLRENRTSIAAFKATAAGRVRGRARALGAPAAGGGRGEPERGSRRVGARARHRTRSRVRSQMAGSIWQVAGSGGRPRQAGDKLVVLETMKMETVVAAPNDGVVSAVYCKQGTMATARHPARRPRRGVAHVDARTSSAVDAGHRALVPHRGAVRGHRRVAPRLRGLDPEVGHRPGARPDWSTCPPGASGTCRRNEDRHVLLACGLPSLHSFQKMTSVLSSSEPGPMPSGVFFMASSSLAVMSNTPCR